MAMIIWQSIVYVVVFLCGWLSGAYFTRSTKVPEKDLSICSCTHKYSMHNDKGKCNVAVIKKVNYAQREFGCACVRYDGIPPGHIYMKDV